MDCRGWNESISFARANDLMKSSRARCLELFQRKLAAAWLMVVIRVLADQGMPNIIEARWARYSGGIAQDMRRSRGIARRSSARAAIT